MTYLVRVEREDGSRTTIATDAVSEEQAATLCRERGRVVWVRDSDEDGWQDMTPAEDTENGGS